MGMNKDLFTEKLKPIGYLKRKWGGSVEGDQWEELVLKLFPGNTDCPPCSHVEFTWKQTHWNRKCLVCGEKTRVSSVFTK